MHRIFIIPLAFTLTISLLVWPIAAKEKDSQALKNPQAAMAMKKALDFYQSAKSLSIKFTADVFWSATEQWNSSQGTLWLKDNDEFHLFLPEMEMISNGKVLWKYSKENNQVVIQDYRASGENAHPSQILFKFLKCQPVSLDTVKEQKKVYLKITMDVTENLKEYDSLEVYLDSHSFTPYKIRTLDAAENRSVYTVKKIKRNITFKKKDFQFSAPKGVEQVDLRE